MQTQKVSHFKMVALVVFTKPGMSIEKREVNLGVQVLQSTGLAVGF